MGEFQIVAWGGPALLFLSAFGFWLRSRALDRRERERMRRAEASGLHLPASLHPIIDPDLCISSTACVPACPEGDVLGIVGGTSRLIRGAACIGHGQCAAECPVDAIRLVFGTRERGVDIPYLTPDFETSRPGISIAGELGGMGLIKNAVRQGVGAARHAIEALPAGNTDGVVDLLVVGAGPAGLGAALACIESNRSYALIEQDTIGGTVAHYPRHKVVMTEPVELPLFGRVHRATMTKEELLALWDQVITETGVKAQTGVKLLGIDGEDGDFRVETSTGQIRCKKVVLAIGRRGSPRKLNVPGEEYPTVTYRLTDPEQYEGKAVLVAGGGDSALEAALALVDEEGVRVSLSYRGEGFFRAKEKNRTAVEEMHAAGRLSVYLQTTVAKIEEGHILLNGHAGEQTIEAEFVIAALGGELPTALLQKLDIRVDRWFGAPPEGSDKSTRVLGPERAAGLGWLGNALFVLSVLATALLAWVGREYYVLDAAGREAFPLDPQLRPSGIWGHGIGVAATLVMLTNFFYAGRKRLSFMRRLGSIRRWLTVHVLVGLFTPVVIAFHAAFQSKNLVATVTYFSVAAVVTTGLIGRYAYGRLQGGGGFGGKALALARLKRFMRVWRLIHVLLALVMVLTILGHVAVTVLFGYRWIF